MSAVGSLVSVLLQACAVCAGATGSSRSQVLANFVNSGSAVDLSDPKGQVAARAMLALDNNFDGQVSSDELRSYALLQGIDSMASAREFTTLDLNGDGFLDVSEVAGVLGDQGNTAPPIQAVPVPPSQAVSVSAAAAHSVVEPGPVAMEQAQVVSQEPSIARGNHHGRNSFLSAVSKASRDVAQLMKSREDAQKVVVQLDAEARSTAQAVELERHAEELRAKASALAELTAHQALGAAENAAAAKATELMRHMKDFDLQAKNDEMQAAMLRSKLYADMEHSIALSAVGSASLEELSHLPK